MTPFAVGAQQAGFFFQGGKLDDITVLVAYVTDASSIWFNYSIGMYLRELDSLGDRPYWSRTVFWRKQKVLSAYKTALVSL